MTAAGNYIPPMFIFPRKRMSPLLMRNGPPCAKYECSPKGWINEELFVAWLKHFIYHSKASKENVVLLILDNHNSHATCREHGVIMLLLPPHCSHRMQPLDVTFYSTLKAAFKQECDLCIKTRHLTRITPYDLVELFNKAYSKVATIATAVSGFKSTGIEPFDPNIFTDNDFLAADELLPQTNISLPTMDNDELGQRSEDTTQKVQAGSSTSSNLNIEQQEESGSTDFTPAVTFEELMPLPGPSTSKKAPYQREKQKSEMLTSTLKKEQYEQRAQKRKIKDIKKQNAQLKKHSINILSQLDNQSCV